MDGQASDGVGASSGAAARHYHFGSADDDRGLFAPGFQDEQPSGCCPFWLVSRRYIDVQAIETEAKKNGRGNSCSPDEG